MKLDPEWIPCRSCHVGPGAPCVMRLDDGTYGMTPRPEPHARRNVDAAEASKLLAARSTT